MGESQNRPITFTQSPPFSTNSHVDSPPISIHRKRVGFHPSETKGLSTTAAAEYTKPLPQDIHIVIALGDAAKQEEPTMGLSYNVYLNSDKIFGCKNCKTHLASHDSIISRVGHFFSDGPCLPHPSTLLSPSLSSTMHFLRLPIMRLSFTPSNPSYYRISAANTAKPSSSTPSSTPPNPTP